MALHIVTLAIKVLLDFFQKIAGFQRAEPLVALRRGRNPLSQKRAGELEDPPEGSSYGAKLHNTTEQNLSFLRTIQ